MKKLRWGVIGAGGIADTRFMPGLRKAENAELVAVMCRTAERAELLREKHGAKRAYTSEEALLADPEIDAVYIATPVSEHCRQGRLAADAGKHILMEKPLSMTAAEGEDLLAYCAGRNVRVGAGFMMRFGSHAQRMRRLVAEGEIGKVISGFAQFTLWLPYDPNNWRLQKAKAGGGALMDMGVHCVDLMRYITGRQVTHVAAMNETVLFGDQGYDVEDSSTVLLRMEGGAQLVVQSNFNLPYAATKWRLELFGSQGRLLGDGILGQEDGGRLNAVLAKDLPTLPPRPALDGGETLEGDFGDLYTREIESFSRSILTNSPLEVPAEEALADQRIVEAAYESTRLGKWIALEEGKGSSWR